MTKGGLHMKYLKIEGNKGYFTIDGTNWLPIDEIDKHHLLKLLDFALEKDFEMDEFESEKIGNQAHQIIYKNIFEKLNDLKNKKERFKDESEALYKNALEKYSSPPSPV